MFGVHRARSTFSCKSFRVDEDGVVICKQLYIRLLSLLSSTQEAKVSGVTVPSTWFTRRSEMQQMHQLLQTTTTVPSTDRVLLLRQVRTAYVQAHGLSQDAHQAWSRALLENGRHTTSRTLSEDYGRWMLRSDDENSPNSDENIKKHKEARMAWKSSFPSNPETLPDEEIQEILLALESHMEKMRKEIADPQAEIGELPIEDQSSDELSPVQTSNAENTFCPAPPLLTIEEQ